MLLMNEFNVISINKKNCQKLAWHDTGGFLPDLPVSANIFKNRKI